MKYSILIIIVLVIASCVSSSLNEGGIFNETDKIELYSPSDGAFLSLTSFPVIFRWDGNEADKEVILGISKNLLAVDNKEIINKTDIVAGWRESFGYGENGNLNSSDLRIINHEDFSESGSFSFESSTTYYWTVWSYNDDSNLYRSSSSYSFTVLE